MPGSPETIRKVGESVGVAHLLNGQHIGVSSVMVSARAFNLAWYAACESGRPNVLTRAEEVLQVPGADSEQGVLPGDDGSVMWR